MLTITCPDAGVEQTLSDATALSSHSIEEATVTYHKCGCGRLVATWAGGNTHVSAAVLCDHVAQDASADRTVGEYLEFLAVLDGAGAWTPVVRHLVHDIVVALYQAVGGTGRPVPELDDAPVAHLRAIGRLAESTVANAVTVDAQAAMVLDSQCRYLSVALQ